MKNSKCTRCKKKRIIHAKNLCTVCYQKEYYENNREKIKERHKKYHKNNREKIKERHKKYCEKNKEKLAKQAKEYYKKNKNKINRQHKKYQEKNKNKINKYLRDKRKIDQHYRLSKILRQRLWEVLHVKNIKKSTSALKLVSCSLEFLKEYLEGKFTKGMTWNNYGDWHIDHIKPLAKFDLTKLSQQKKAFHYTNLQPLWAADNIRKGNTHADS